MGEAQFQSEISSKNGIELDVKEEKPMNQTPTNGKTLNVDGFLKIVGGYGKFQWFLTAIFCLLFVPDICQTFIMYFAAQEPSWRCVDNSTICTLNGTHTSDENLRCKIPRNQWEFVEPESHSIVIKYNIYCERAWLTHMTSSIFFFGQLLGFISLGWLADRFGRKTVLFPSAMVMLCFTLLCSVMPNIGWFLFCRFVVGFSSAIGNLLLLMTSEFVSTKHRPIANSILWIGWTLAMCLLALKAYLVRDWKMLFVITSAPYFILLLSYKFVPESIRWLRSMGRVEEATSVFKKLAYWNGKTLDPALKMSSPIIKEKQQKVTPLHLFKTKRLTVLTIVQGFVWLVIGIVYYGLSLAADDLGGSIYLNFVLVSIVELPASFIAIDFSNRFGRRKTTCISMLLGGIFCSIVPFIHVEGNGSTMRVALGVLGKMLVALSYDVVCTWSLELYPTNIRSIALSFVSVACNVGSAGSPWVAKGLKVFHESVPFIVMGCLSLVAGFVGFILPETKGLETKDTMDEYDDVPDSCEEVTQNSVLLKNLNEE